MLIVYTSSTRDALRWGNRSFLRLVTFFITNKDGQAGSLSVFLYLALIYRMVLQHLKTYRPLLYNELLLSGKLYTILADLDEQAAERCRLIVQQMAQAEGITEELKATDPVRWVQAMNSIRSRAEEIIQAEMIYV